MVNSLRFRTVADDDFTELVLMLDMAGGRLPSHLWNPDSGQGQSYFEHGRE